MMKIHTQHSKQQGFTLLEVMIAIVIFAIGMLGIAGLQILSKKSNYEAVQRTTATMLTNDIISRMRANNAMIDQNTSELDDYVATLPADLPATEPAACTEASPCTPAEVTARDLWEWYDALIGATDLNAAGDETGGLVQPTACITKAAAPRQYTIAIAWRGKTALSNPGGNTCGDASGNYDGPTTGDNVYRRLISLDIYIEWVV